LIGIGHPLINRTDLAANALEIGNAEADDVCPYPDIDVIAGPLDDGYRRMDGTPWSVGGA
jgi:uncharacterized cupin superfamily protein